MSRDAKLRHAPSRTAEVESEWELRVSGQEVGSRRSRGAHGKESSPAFIAPEPARVVLGPSWVAATLQLLILAFYGVFRAFMDFSGSLFSAVGRPRIVAALRVIVILASSFLLSPLTEVWGIEGTAVAMTLPVIGVFGLSLWATGRALQATARDGRSPGSTGNGRHRV